MEELLYSTIGATRLHGSPRPVDKNLIQLIKEYSYNVVKREDTNVLKIKKEYEKSNYIAYTRLDGVVYKIKNVDLYLSQKELKLHLENNVSQKYIYFEIYPSYERVGSQREKHIIYEDCERENESIFRHYVTYCAYEIIKAFKNEEEFKDDIARIFYVRSISIVKQIMFEDDDEPPTELEIQHCLGFMEDLLDVDQLYVLGKIQSFSSINISLSIDKLEEYCLDTFSKTKTNILFYLREIINLFLSF
jgi:hypothetical protein